MLFSGGIDLFTSLSTPVQRSSRRTQQLSSLGLVILAGLIAGAVPFLYIASGFSLEWKDTIALYAPLRGDIVEALRHFRLPLWNPNEAMGMPLFAQMPDLVDFNLAENKRDGHNA